MVLWTINHVIVNYYSKEEAEVTNTALWPSCDYSKKTFKTFVQCNVTNSSVLRYFSRPFSFAYCNYCVLKYM